MKKLIKFFTNAFYFYKIKNFIKYSKKHFFIHSLDYEIEFFKNLNLLNATLNEFRARGIVYTSDFFKLTKVDLRLNSFIDTVRMFKIKFGTSISFNRASQLFWFLKGFKNSFLMIFRDEKSKLFRSLVVLENKFTNKWLVIDYGIISPEFVRFEKLLEFVSEKYKTPLEFYCFLDIEWDLYKVTIKKYKG